MKKTTWQWD